MTGILLYTRDDRQAVDAFRVQYALALDTKDWGLFQSLFEDKVTLDLSSFNGSDPVELSADDLTEYARNNLEGMITQHLSTNVTTVFSSADTTTATSYLVAQHRKRNDRGDIVPYDMHGRYIYSIRRTQSEWRIHAMKMILSWDEGDPSIIGLDRAPVMNLETASPTSK